MKLSPSDERFLKNEAFLSWFASSEKKSLNPDKVSSLKQSFLSMLDELADFLFITPAHIHTIEQELLDLDKILNSIRDRMSLLKSEISPELLAIFDFEDAHFENTLKAPINISSIDKLTYLTVIYQNWLEGYLYWILLTQNQ